jgi:hypothetical protein
LLAAAIVIAFKDGGAGLGPIALALNVSLGAYVPIAVLPSWVGPLAEWNPVSAALVRERRRGTLTIY